MRLQPRFPDAVPDAAEAAYTWLSGDVRLFRGPAQRVDIFFELRDRARNDAAEPRLERVCRVLELEQS